MFSVYYDPITSMSGSGAGIVNFEVNQNTLIDVVRLTLVLIDNPTITSFRCRINQYDSDLVNVSSFATLKNGYYDVYFPFQFRAWANKDAVNNLRLLSDNYTYSSNSHVGFVRDWPDQVYGPIMASNKLNDSTRLFHIAGQRFSGV